MRDSRFSRLKQYCERKAEEDNSYLFVLGWAADCESARQIAQGQIEHNTQMQQTCQPEYVDMHRRQVIAAQDVLKRIGG